MKHLQDPKTGKMIGSIGNGKSKPPIAAVHAVPAPKAALEKTAVEETYALHRLRAEQEANEYIDSGVLAKMFEHASQEIDWNKFSDPKAAKETAQLLFQKTIPQTVRYVRRDVRQKILTCKCVRTDAYGNQEQAQDCPLHGDGAAIYLSAYDAQIADPDGVIAEALAGEPLPDPWAPVKVDPWNQDIPF